MAREIMLLLTVDLDQRERLIGTCDPYEALSASERYQTPGGSIRAPLLAREAK